MTNKVKKEVEKLIKKYDINCSVEEFKDKVNWNSISIHQILSESFIKEFKDKVNWNYISKNQKLSENFMREFKDEVSWINISYCQKLSLDFIREFEDKVDWYYISEYQKLSEYFIYELSFILKSEIFKKYFIKTDKITKERLLELKKENTIYSRFEILQL